jgi:magnesium-transporting ATPase (P-type)
MNEDKTRSVRRARRGHFIFHLLYGLLTVILFILPVVTLYFQIAFQSALLSFAFYTAALIAALRPNDNGRVVRATRLTFCVAAFISIVLVVIASINPIVILTSNNCTSLSSDATVVDICLNEKSFMVYYLIFMALILLLQFVSLLWHTFNVKDE